MMKMFFSTTSSKRTVKNVAPKKTAPAPKKTASAHKKAAPAPKKAAPVRDMKRKNGILIGRGKLVIKE